MRAGRGDEPLSREERDQAKRLEKIVESGLASYQTVGDALFEIREQRLFVGKFKEYVWDRFELEPWKSNRLIRCALVANRIKTAGLPVPKNEGQAHILHELEPDEDKQVELWRAVLKLGKRPTAELIREVANPTSMNEEPQAHNEAGIVNTVLPIESEARNLPAEVSTVSFPTDTVSLIWIDRFIDDLNRMEISPDTPVKALLDRFIRVEDTINILRSMIQQVSTVA